MKHKLTFALVVLMTSTAFAAFQAPLPEFKNEKQLAEWRAEKAPEAAKQGYAAEETAFYTGRPYVTSAGGYTFKYRDYNPELARWTSEDPSGFPDGVNPYCYINNQITNSFDYLGLQKVKTVLWLVAFHGNNTQINASGLTEMQAAATYFRGQMTEADKRNPSPQYLSDGDTLSVASASSLNDISTFNSSYDQIYLIAHGEMNHSGNLTGKWLVGNFSYDSADFQQFGQIQGIYGCNPTGGQVSTVQIVSAIAKPTSQYLYE